MADPTARDRIIGAMAAEPDPRLPYAMNQPPAMSNADVDLYRGNAYGTPHEAHITGPAEAAAYAYSLRSPALAYGLDLSRVKEVPGGPEPMAWGERMTGRRVFGFYLPDEDTGYAIRNPVTSPGSILTHEAMHRAYARLGADLRQSAPAPPVPGAPDFLERYDAYKTGRRLADPATEHQLMDVEERMLGGTGRTRMVSPIETDGFLTDDNARFGRPAIGQMNGAIERLRRQRGDFSRMGPR
jgi:hypothetical protein